MNEANNSMTIKQKAWARYFARTLDMFLMGIPIMILIMVILLMAIEFMNIELSSFLGDAPELVYDTIIMLFYFALEGLIISKFKTTIGKKIWGITIAKENGKRLSYRDSIERNITIFVKGFGVGIPIVNIIMLVISYGNYKEKEITPWDETYDVQVEFKELSRLQFYIRLIGSLIFMFSVGFFFSHVI